MTLDEAARILEIEPTAGASAARRAYLRKLKIHKPERDPDGFMRIRAAYDRFASSAGGDLLLAAMLQRHHEAGARGASAPPFTRVPSSVPVVDPPASPSPADTTGSLIIDTLTATLAAVGLEPSLVGSPLLFPQAMRRILELLGEGDMERPVALHRALDAYADDPSGTDPPRSDELQWLHVSELCYLAHDLPRHALEQLALALRANDLALAEDVFRDEAVILAFMDARRAGRTPLLWGIDATIGDAQVRAFVQRHQRYERRLWAALACLLVGVSFGWFASPMLGWTVGLGAAIVASLVGVASSSLKSTWRARVPERASSPVRVALRWALASFLGGAPGGALGWLLVPVAPPAHLAGFALFHGLILGGAQGAILSRYVTSGGAWMAVTTLMFWVAGGLGTFAARSAHGHAVLVVLVSTATGAGIGIAQWLVLRRGHPRAWSWPLACVVVWTALGAVSASAAEGYAMDLFGAPAYLGVLLAAPLAWTLGKFTEVPARRAPTPTRSHKP
jgi:hypothetical protein